ncbi:MAG: RnfABCDGE type electron transport complex subunit G [Bacteroidales bacterium]
MARESTLINLVVTLGAITMLASATVAGVYSLTKNTIAQAKITKKNNAIALVVPEFDNAPSNEKMAFFAEGDSLFMYPAMREGKSVGFAVETFSDNAFSGRIKLMVGFLPDGTISGISVIEQNETPGLGAKMIDVQVEGKKPVFTTQFVGKHPKTSKLTVTKDGGEVDAITASTISSRAFCEAVQRAYDVVMTQPNFTRE